MENRCTTPERRIPSDYGLLKKMWPFHVVYYSREKILLRFSLTLITADASGNGGKIRKGRGREKEISSSLDG